MTAADIYEYDADGEIVDYREDIKAHTVGVGEWGVFSGEWDIDDDTDAPLARYRTGYGGILDGHWNGWCVFSTTRNVVEALIVAQNTNRAELAAELARQHPDWSSEQVGTHVDNGVQGLAFDGDTLTVHGSPDGKTRELYYAITPDERGLYWLGLDWCWDAVHPAVCDRVIEPA